MPTINLLPWREELRQRRQNEFLVTAAIAALVMAGVIFGVELEFNNRIEFQQQRNQYLVTEISKLDKKIAKIKNLEKERSSLLARMEIIQALQSSRPEIVHLFDELVTTLPEGVYYTRIQQSGAALEVSGIAQSNARVSTLMRNIDKSEWLQNPVLVEIKKRQETSTEADQQRLSEFTLRFSQIVKKKESEEDESS